MNHEKRPERSHRSGLTRRETLLAGIALLGGGFSVQGIFFLRTGKPAPPGEGDPEDLLALPDRDLLCLADSILDRTFPPHRKNAARRLFLRLLAAALDIPSEENDRLAARVIAVLGRRGWITPAVEDLVRAGRGVPAARAALERALSHQRKRRGA